jgi:hypothetical protein
MKFSLLQFFGCQVYLNDKHHHSLPVTSWRRHPQRPYQSAWQYDNGKALYLGKHLCTSALDG